MKYIVGCPASQFVSLIHFLTSWQLISSYNVTQFVHEVSSFAISNSSVFACESIRPNVFLYVRSPSVARMVDTWCINTAIGLTLLEILSISGHVPLAIRLCIQGRPPNEFLIHWTFEPFFCSFVHLILFLHVDHFPLILPKKVISSQFLAKIL